MGSGVPSTTNNGVHRYARAPISQSAPAPNTAKDNSPKREETIRGATPAGHGPSARPTAETAQFARTQARHDPHAAQMRSRADQTLHRGPQGTTHYGPGIDVKGSDRFRRGVVKDLDQIDHTNTGHGLIQSLNTSGHKTTIREGHEPVTDDKGRVPAVQRNGRPGPRNDAEIRYEPSDHRVNMGSKAWERNLPTSVLLEHELVHAEHITHGTAMRGNDPRTGVPNEELGTVGLKRNPLSPTFTENAYRKDLGLPRRTEY